LLSGLIAMRSRTSGAVHPLAKLWNENEVGWQRARSFKILQISRRVVVACSTRMSLKYSRDDPRLISLRVEDEPAL